MAKAVQVQVLSRAPISKMTSRWFFFLLLALCGAGCASQSDHPPALRVMGAGVATDTRTTDEAIGFEVRRQFSIIDPAEMAGVVVEVDGGVVTLHGTAPSLAVAWRAEAAARAVKGVQQVRNQILSGRSR